MPANVALIYEARRLTTGANVHELAGAIKIYERACSEPDPASRRVEQRLEKRLTTYVQRLRSQRARSAK